MSACNILKQFSSTLVFGALCNPKRSIGSLAGAWVEPQGAPEHRHMHGMVQNWAAGRQLSCACGTPDGSHGAGELPGAYCEKHCLKERMKSNFLFSLSLNLFMCSVTSSSLVSSTFLIIPIFFYLPLLSIFLGTFFILLLYGAPLNGTIYIVFFLLFLCFLQISLSTIVHLCAVYLTSVFALNKITPVSPPPPA